MGFYFRYVDSAGAEQSAAYQGNGFSSKLTTESISSNTLRGVSVEHPTFKRRIWNVAISADELRNTAALDFLEAFWAANVKYLGVSDGTTTEYKRVTHKAGDFPINYIDGIRAMPEVAFQLTERTPTGARFTAENPYDANG